MAGRCVGLCICPDGVIRCDRHGDAHGRAQGGVKPELVLTMFTSVVGFLAGLFVPSQTANRQG